MTCVFFQAKGWFSQKKAKHNFRILSVLFTVSTCYYTRAGYALQMGCFVVRCTVACIVNTEQRGPIACKIVF